MDNDTLTLEDLAKLSGTTRRTIRYYIQEGLVDRPTGRGRGAAYTKAHLEQLLTVRRWQQAGVSLERIRELREPPAELAALAEMRRPGSVEVWSHVVLTDGVELHVEPHRAGLSPEQVRELAAHIGAYVARLKEENTDAPDNT